MRWTDSKDNEIIKNYSTGAPRNWILKWNFIPSCMSPLRGLNCVTIVGMEHLQAKTVILLSEPPTPEISYPPACPLWEGGIVSQFSPPRKDKQEGMKFHFKNSIVGCSGRIIDESSYAFCRSLIFNALGWYITIYFMVWYFLALQSSKKR